MRARLVVFPIKGKNWCFSRSIDLSTSESSAASTPSTVKELCKKISSNSKPLSANAELLVDFISNKMNKAWIGLEKAAEGSFKNKLHGLGLRLLARVKPSEILLKSITKDVTNVLLDCWFVPHTSNIFCSLNARLVRRRLRQIALRGTVLHRKYFYGSVSLLPLTTAFTVLPLPNIPFFWVLFRTYSHWRAVQGSEKLLQLVSDYSLVQNSIILSGKGNESEHNDSKCGTKNSPSSQWVLEPSKELEDLINRGHEENYLSEQAISDICNSFSLNKNDVLKCRDLV
ncbi:uncharacterized protein LOC105774095 isoform X1 [Gossypium raimondii]|uniref:uncharacterized protein LOC105774095 isoform X1 n=1 Tax=Gossypium raimondii TaxID=29730 RepID=UPI00227C103D|nr:uncharacterized protein LOC105774095 isoform X1 [Gossypium raimondii]